MTVISKSLLIVDDDPSTRLLLRNFFRKWDGQVLEAPSGNEALEMVAHQIPLAVILDLNMPNGSGWETATALKKAFSTRDIPIIAISGLTEDLVGHDPRDSNWDAFLEKPFSREVLWKTLERLADFP